MDERYSRLQSVIDDLIGERDRILDRILDEAIEMSKDLQAARKLAQEYRDMLQAAGMVMESERLPWEAGNGDD